MAPEVPQGEVMSCALVSQEPQAVLQAGGQSGWKVAHWKGPGGGD